MKTIRIINTSNSLLSELTGKYCSSFTCQLRGLMFRSHIAQDESLLLVQKKVSRLDAAIHMLFVFMDLGIIWIDSDMNVVDLVLAHPWRPAYIPQRPAMYVLETHPSRLAEFKIGDRLEFVDFRITNKKNL